MNETTTYRQLQLTERMHIECWRREGVSLRGMADRLGRSPSTLSRELRRNECGDAYAAEAAQSAVQDRRVLGRPLPKLHPDGVL